MGCAGGLPERLEASRRREGRRIGPTLAGSRAQAETSRVIPETRYAKTADGVHIAYQTRGEGSVDLVYVMQYANNLEVAVEHPREARFLERLGSFSRLILFDKRGTGLSDRDQTPDLRHAGRRSEGRTRRGRLRSSRLCSANPRVGRSCWPFFAATHPDRVLALILYGTLARHAWAPDYPFGMRREEFLARRDALASGWGTFDYVRGLVEEQAPSMAGDADYIRWWAKLQRHSASPAAALAFEDVWYGTDVRAVLGSVQAPTLVLSRTRTDGLSPSRDLADRFPGARHLEFPGRDQVPEAGNMDEILDSAERFVQSIRAEEAQFDRVLATVMFTDIVGSTEKAASSEMPLGRS